MTTKIIKGIDLTEKQISLLPQFHGLLRDKEMFLKCNKFHFSECGNFYSTNKNEYYPITISLAFLPN